MSFLEWLAPLGALGIVPLGLTALGVRGAMVWAGFVPAALVMAAFLLELGWVSALIMLPWVVYASGVLWKRRDVGALYLVASAVCLIGSRLEGRPLGIRDEVLLLCGMHFLYAGFAGNVMVNRIGEMWPDARGGWVYGLTLWSARVGPVVQALGMGMAGVVEFAGAAAMVVGAILMVGMALGWGVIQPVSRGVTLSFSLAGAAAVVAMGLAAIYAVRHVGEAYWVGLPQMAVLHGGASALGYTVFGLLGCVLGQRLPGLVHGNR